MGWWQGGLEAVVVVIVVEQVVVVVGFASVLVLEPRVAWEGSGAGLR